MSEPAEPRILDSILRTVAVNNAAIKRIKILVDGRERETLAGHANLKDFFETIAPQTTSAQ